MSSVFPSVSALTLLPFVGGIAVLLLGRAGRPAARLTAPSRPLPPIPPPVPVEIWMESVIHENSPTSDTTLSPGSSVSSSTGITVPCTRSCMAPPFRWTCPQPDPFEA